MKRWCLSFLFLISCSGLEKSEKEKVKKANMTFHRILRKEDEITIQELDLSPKLREKYPWEKDLIGKLRPITKEYFRCKGNISNPPVQIAFEDDASKVVRDCGGVERHSLPIKDQKEFVYPVLLEILNDIQKKLGSKVIVTCGHRCPEHNRYADPSKAAKTSKHQIGAEVDFYVDGFEYKPALVLNAIKQFYEDHIRYKQVKDFASFTASKTKFENKEIIAYINQKDERRDLDNRHPYPYITLEVKYDIDQKKKVEYSWKEANTKMLLN